MMKNTDGSEPARIFDPPSTRVWIESVQTEMALMGPGLS